MRSKVLASQSCLGQSVLSADVALMWNLSSIIMTDIIALIIHVSPGKRRHYCGAMGHTCHNYKNFERTIREENHSVIPINRHRHAHNLLINPYLSPQRAFFCCRFI